MERGRPRGGFASEIYQYTGSAPGNLNLTFVMDGTLSNFPPDPDGLTYLYGTVAVFPEANYAFSPGLSTLIHEFHAVPKAMNNTSLGISFDTFGQRETRTAVLNFNVNPGEIFYVWERLDASAFRGTRSADAFSTLSASFDRPDLVVSLSTPEPASATLLLTGALGLLLTAGARRRRRR